MANEAVEAASSLNPSTEKPSTPDRFPRSKPWGGRLQRLLATATVVAASTGLVHVHPSEARSTNSSVYQTTPTEQTLGHTPYQVLLEKMPSLINSKHTPSDLHALENNMLKTAVFQNGNSLLFIQESAVDQFNPSGFEIKVPTGYSADQIEQVNDSNTLVSGQLNKKQVSLLIDNQSGRAKILDGKGIVVGGKVYIQESSGLFELNLDDKRLGPKLIQGDIRVVGTSSNENSNIIYVIQNNQLLMLSQDFSGKLTITPVGNSTSKLIDASINGDQINTLQKGSEVPYIINIGNKNIDYRSLELKAIELFSKSKNGEVPPLLDLNHAPIMLNNNAVGFGIMGNEVILYALSAENDYNYPQMTQINCPLSEMKDYQIEDAQIIRINGSNIAILTVRYKNTTNNIRNISYGIYVTAYGAEADAPLIV